MIDLKKTLELARAATKEKRSQWAYMRDEQRVITKWGEHVCGTGTPVLDEYIASIDPQTIETMALVIEELVGALEKYKKAPLDPPLTLNFGEVALKR